FEDDCHGNSGSGAPSAKQHDPLVCEADAASAERLDAAQPVEDVPLPAARSARQRIDGADDLGIRTKRVSEWQRTGLVGDRENQSVEIRNLQQSGQAGFEISGSDADWHQYRVTTAAAKFCREHLGRADLLDRIADDSEDARAPG